MERPREKEDENAFVRLIIILSVVVMCVLFSRRLCDELTVREFYKRECVHSVASLEIGDLSFLFVFGAQL